ncbi:MAG: HD domain-containing phosphohydrolase [Thermodesulfobacteriota bacterium]
MSESILPALLSALDIFAVERVEYGRFRPLGPMPEFSARLCGRVCDRDSDLVTFEGSLFLMHFVEEAESFWRSPSEAPLRSGPWIEADDGSADMSLEASAFSLKERKLLVVQALGIDLQERQHLLQSARESLLLQRQLEVLVRERTRELIRTQEITIETLASLTETRDPETGGHIKRTQNYVRLLGEQLKNHTRFHHYLTDDTVELLYKCAPLHDIGKIGVPDRILLKAGSLTQQEIQEVRKHTQIGRDALLVAEGRLGSNRFLQVAGEIAYTHHERWDGSGYPRGLKGEEIPISGRLMAVADVYDALVSRRIYKPPFGHEQAVSTIREGSGVHFDPDVVDAFLELEEEFRQLAICFADSEEERLALVRKGDHGVTTRRERHAP